VDPFYTPADIAIRMVGAVRERNPSCVADFAAGRGELLRAAGQQWHGATMIATDYCRSSVSRLRRDFSHWSIGRCDFLSKSSRQRCTPLSRLQGTVSVALLNPPFSCRGATRLCVSANKVELTCSRALAFVITSLQYVSLGGEIVVLLPAGSLFTEKDRKAWDFLNAVTVCELVAMNGHKVFNGCRARTAIVHFTKTKECQEPEESCKVKSDPPGVEKRNSVFVLRGRVQMHTVAAISQRLSAPLVHSTDLGIGRLDLSGSRAHRSHPGISGPAVFVPRVGEPNKEKIFLYALRKRVILSDCVIALKCKSPKQTRVLHSTLLRRWTQLEEKYGGTGAKYITIGSLSQFLKGLGFSVLPAHVQRKSHQLVRAIGEDNVGQFSRFTKQLNGVH
jgi:hypothetical protein